MDIQVEMINLTIMLTVVIAGILLTKKLLGNRITPRGHMLMWILVAVLLISWPLAKWMPQTDLAMRNYVPRVAVVEDNYGDEDSGLVMEIPAAHYSNADEKVEEKYVSLTGWAFMLWTGGAVAGMIMMAVGYMRQQKRLKSLPNCYSEVANKIFDEVKSLTSVRKNVLLKCGNDSIMLAGILKPTVYITDENVCDEKELRYIMAHELIHYRHGDIILNIVSVLLLCMLWWNPVIWIGFKQFRTDMEIFCDYDAIRITGDRKGYARMLIKVSAGQKGLVLGTTSLLDTESQLSKRIRTIAAFKKPRAIVSMLAVCVLISMGIAVATVPVAAKQASKTETESERYLKISQAVEFLQETDLGGAEDGYVLQNIESMSDGVKLNFGQSGSKSFWDELGGAPEMRTAYDEAEGAVVLEVKRCTEGYGIWLMENLKSMFNGLILDYEVEPDGDDAVCIIYHNECKCSIIEEEGNISLFILFE